MWVKVGRFLSLLLSVILVAVVWTFVMQAICYGGNLALSAMGTRWNSPTPWMAFAIGSAAGIFSFGLLLIAIGTAEGQLNQPLFSDTQDAAGPAVNDVA